MGTSHATVVNEQIQEQITKILSEMLLVEVPSPETDLIATGALDSLGLVELFVQLENRFGVRVDMADLEVDHFRSVASIVAFVSARRSEGAPR